MASGTGPRRWSAGDLLNAAQVEEIVPLSRSAVYRLLGDGTIPSFKVGGKIAVLRSDVESYLDSCRLGRSGTDAEPVQIDPDAILEKIRSEGE